MNISLEMLKVLPLWFVAFLLSLTCHEAAHALAAKLGGDSTAADGGQVSLDPLPHIRREPLGTIVVPLASFFLQGGQWMIGWASAPYDPYWAERHPKRAALMAGAGPLANFVLVLVAAGLIHAGIAGGWVLQPSTIDFDQLVLGPSGEPTAGSMFLSVVFSLNVLLGTFNLLPLPPLDGHGIVPLFLSDRATRRYHEIFRGSGAILGLLIAWVVFGRLWSWIFGVAIAALYPGSHYGF